MRNGRYELPDGTLYERDSGEEIGPNGYWYRWTRLRGVSGQVPLALPQAPSAGYPHELFFFPSFLPFFLPFLPFFPSLLPIFLRFFFLLLFFHLP